MAAAQPPTESTGFWSSVAYWLGLGPPYSVLDGVDFGFYVFDDGRLSLSVLGESISLAVNVTTDGDLSFAVDMTNDEEEEDDDDDADSDGGGAGEEAIAALPKKTCQPQTVGEKAEECPVCLEVYETGQTLATMPCEHEFHEACISDWLRISRLCPLCRFELPPPAAAGQDQDRS